MADGPTTINGPLHTDAATVPDRQITAYFSSLEQAQSVRDALVSANIPAHQITITLAAEQADRLEPTDQSLVGKIREALVPEDSQRTVRDAVASGDAALMVTPAEGDVDRVVEIIQAGKPHHFDADLECWRNSPPT